MKFGIFSVVDHYPSDGDRNVGQFYNELLVQIEIAEKLGFESFWIAEHHFHNYGVVPRPPILLAAAAQRTKQITLGSAVVVLPFDNPIRTAEDYAMLDVLSNGRLNIGIGSGYLQHEYEGFGIDPSEKRERFDECFSVLMKAWSGQKFSHSGRFYNLKDVCINVTPTQQPRPPIWIAILRPEAAQHVGKSGFPIMLIPYATSESIAEVADIVRVYKSAAAHSTNSLADPSVAFGLHVYCARTTEQARQEARPWIERYTDTRLYAKKKSFEWLIENNLVAIGDPDEIARVIKLYEAAGLTDLLAIANFGGMPHNKAVHSMELMGRHVLPMISTSLQIE